MAWPVVAGGGRSWPEWVDKAPKERVDSGTSVVQLVKMGFCKRRFGKRSYRSLERALQGEEDGAVVGS